MMEWEDLLPLFRSLKPEHQAEVFDFVNFLREKEAKKARAVFDAWAAECPYDDEPMPPGEAERIDAALAETETISGEELYREVGLN